MARFVVLYRFSDRGLKEIKGTVRRARESREASARHGFRLLDVLWTQGRYDAVAIVEAPDEKAMMAGMLDVVGGGHVRSETLRAFTEQEMEAIIAA